MESANLQHPALVAICKCVRMLGLYPGNCYPRAKIYAGAQLCIAAQRIGQLDLPRRVAFRLKQLWTADDKAGAKCARSCDIEAIQIIQEFHSARGIFG